MLLKKGGLIFRKYFYFVPFPLPPHCTEIDFALSFGAVLVKMIDWSKTESRDFFGIILGQENSQKLYLLPKSC